jgi:hypothetical protein
MVPVNHTRLLFKIIIIPAYRLHLKKEMIGICNDCSTEHCADKIQDEDKQNTTQHRKQKR